MAPPLQIGQQVRRLPIVPRPFPDESVISYVNRCAASNHLHPPSYKHFLHTHSGTRRPIGVEQLAAATGLGPERLRQALPELRLDTLRFFGRPHPQGYLDQPHPACRRCASRHAARNVSVTAWRRPHRPLCPMHQRWLRSLYSAHHGPDDLSLQSCPEIVKANRQHRRLIQRFGPAKVDNAFNTATTVVEQACRRRAFGLARDRRLDRLGATDIHFTYSNPYFQAANYPDAVVIAQTMLTHRARPRPAAERLKILRSIYTDLARLLDEPGLQRDRALDPIFGWVFRLDDPAGC